MQRILIILQTIILITQITQIIIMLQVMIRIMRIVISTIILHPHEITRLRTTKAIRRAISTCARRPPSHDTSPTSGPGLILEISPPHKTHKTHKTHKIHKIYNKMCKIHETHKTRGTTTRHHPRRRRFPEIVTSLACCWWPHGKPPNR